MRKLLLAAVCSISLVGCGSFVTVAEQNSEHLKITCSTPNGILFDEDNVYAAGFKYENKVDNTRKDWLYFKSDDTTYHLVPAPEKLTCTFEKIKEVM